MIVTKSDPNHHNDSTRIGAISPCNVLQLALGAILPQYTRGSFEVTHLDMTDWQHLDAASIPASHIEAHEVPFPYGAASLVREWTSYSLVFGFIVRGPKET